MFVKPFSQPIFLLILYSEQSFRIGATTTAAAAGISDSTIQILGQWQSSAYLLYVRLNQLTLPILSATMAHCTI